MITFSEMIADVNADLPGLPSTMVKDVLNRTQRNLCRHWPWVWLEATYNLATFAPMVVLGDATDYVTVTSGGTTITRVGTAGSHFTTDSGLSGTLTGVYRIRLGGQDQNYIVTSVDEHTLTLHSSTPYVGASLTVTDLAGAMFFRNLYTLSTEIEIIEGMRSSWKMDSISQEDLDLLDPRRQTSGQPTRYCISGGSTPTVELWPVPDDAYVMQYWGQRRAITLSATTDVPLLDGDVLVKLAKVQLATRYMRLFPNEAKLISAMIPLWKTDADESMSDLIRQDGRVRTERPAMIDHLGTPRISSSMIEYDLEETG